MTVSQGEEWTTLLTLHGPTSRIFVKNGLPWSLWTAHTFRLSLSYLGMPQVWVGIWANKLSGDASVRGPGWGARSQEVSPVAPARFFSCCRKKEKNSTGQQHGQTRECVARERDGSCIQVHANIPVWKGDGWFCVGDSHHLFDLIWMRTCGVGPWWGSGSNLRTTRQWRLPT